MSPMRRATTEDNAALLRLFGDVPMQGELVLSTQRSPDYFALFELQRGTTEVWVHEEGGQTGRDGRHPGPRGLAGRANPCRVGYLGDLRSRFSARRTRGLAPAIGPILEEAADRHGSARLPHGGDGQQLGGAAGAGEAQGVTGLPAALHAADPLLGRVHPVRAAPQATPGAL